MWKDDNSCIYCVNMSIWLETQITMSHSNESSNSNYPIYDNYLLQTQNQQKYDRRSPRGTLQNSVLNSPDLAEVHIQPPQNIKVGRSPNFFENSPNSTGSVDYTSLCSSDNIVVYDDIGQNWLNLNKTNDEQENIIGEPSLSMNSKACEFFWLFHLLISFLSSSPSFRF